MYIDQLRRLREQEGGPAAGPRWAQRTVQTSVVGMLVLPVMTALAMAGKLGLSDPDARGTLTWSIGGLWAACFLAAMIFCCRSPAPHGR